MLFYKAPTDKIFNDVKRASIHIFNNRDHHEDYLSKKLEDINEIENTGVGFMTIVNMHDHWGKEVMASLISKDSCDAIIERIKSGYDTHTIGLDLELNPFFEYNKSESKLTN